MHRLSLYLLMIALVFFTSCDNKTSSDTSSLDLEKRIPVDSNLVTGVLDNGMTYYILENLKPEKRAELRLHKVAQEERCLTRFKMAVTAGRGLRHSDNEGMMPVGVSARVVR